MPAYRFLEWSAGVGRRSALSLNPSAVPWEPAACAGGTRHAVEVDVLIQILSPDAAAALTLDGSDETGRIRS
jgi:hypothetical protein